MSRILSTLTAVGLIAAAALAPVAIVPPAFGTSTTKVPTGIAAGSQILNISASDADAELAGIAATGAPWVRTDLTWYYIEPSRGQWRWDVTDRVVADAARHHLRIELILGYAPPWAMVLGQPDPAAFAEFAAAAVDRYGRTVNTWEIWNEENMSWAWPTVSADAYGKLLQAAYSAIHAKQPAATVLMGGLGRAPDAATRSQTPYTFVSQLLTAGYGASFDAVAFHPYTFPDWPDEPVRAGEPEYQNGMAEMVSVQDLLAQYGLGRKRFWVTEFGAPTGNIGNDVTPQTQADMITRAYKRFTSYNWAGPFFVYSWRDDGSDTFGLLESDGVRKPAYGSFAALTRATAP
jgi:beta-xylosidase